MKLVAEQDETLLAFHIKQEFSVPLTYLYPHLKNSE